MENKIKHLEMLQAVINRMAANSFSLKGWSVVLVSALFALASKDSKPYFIYLAFFPAVVFWILDGYFLWQERLFRKLYDEVRVKPEKEIDFSMNTLPVTKTVKSWFSTMFSTTLRIFHGIIVVTIVIVAILVNWDC